jgi:hypothetical protein
MKQLNCIFNKISAFADGSSISLVGAAAFLQGACFTALGIGGVLNHQDGTSAVPAKMTLGIGIITLALVSVGYAYNLYDKKKKKQANNMLPR